MAREYPHDIEAERSLLGSMLISGDACQSILSLATKEDFYLDSHRLLFEAMQFIDSQNNPDVVTLDGSSYLIDKETIRKSWGSRIFIAIGESLFLQLLTVSII